jgi:alkylated DNA repair dioxygenase AlkB
MAASLNAEAEFERLWLDEGSWVDVARGWLAGADEVLDAVMSSVSFRQGRLFRYERWIDEPRLGAGIGAGRPHPHPVLGDAQQALSARYGHRFDGYGLALYRDGHDLQAFHRDRDLRWLDDTVIILLTLGARRSWFLRPRDNRYVHDDNKGATHDLRPGPGDLMVMGGATQLGWEHSVPPQPGVRDPRVSVQWRWTSRRGRPVEGASYRAPRTFSRR